MEKFKKGDIVWAKIRGYPWWPGIVAHIDDGSDEERDPKILVNFIGDNSHAELPLNKVSNFEENLKEYSKSKKKDLLDSIELAQKIKSGETSYEEELTKVEKRDRSKNAIKKKRTPKGRDDSDTAEFSEEDDEYANGFDKRKFKKTGENGQLPKKRKRGRPPTKLNSKTNNIEEAESEEENDEVPTSELEYSMRQIKMRKPNSSMGKNGAPAEMVRGFFAKLRMKNEFMTAETSISNLLHCTVGQILEEFEKLQELLLNLFKAEVNLILLMETKIGKTLTKLLEFCQKDSALDKICKITENILNKWKIYVNTTLFDGADTQQLSIPQLQHNNSSNSFTPRCLLNKAIMDLELQKTHSGMNGFSEEAKISPFARVIDEVLHDPKNLIDSATHQKEEFKLSDGTHAHPITLPEEARVDNGSTIKLCEHLNDSHAKEAFDKKDVEVINPQLRKSVCRTLARLLEEKSAFEKADARNSALQLEANLRIIDPDMKSLYTDHFVELVKELRTLQGNSIKEFIRKKADIIANV